MLTKEISEVEKKNLIIAKVSRVPIEKDIEVPFSEVEPRLQAYIGDVFNKGINVGKKSAQAKFDKFVKTMYDFAEHNSDFELKSVLDELSSKQEGKDGK